MTTEYIPGLEYLLMQKGGVCYYTQNRPGTKWFDTVSNSKGWTIDFNLKVVNVDNGDVSLYDDYNKGSGLYINDGTRKEVIIFLTQEIIFRYANRRIVFDTTSQTDYRLIGKDEQLKLFAKKSDESSYSLIADVEFLESSSSEANGLKPKITEDKYRDLHAVWYDDENKVGRLFYSYYKNGFWSDPFLLADKVEGSQSPDISIDEDDNIYVAYESKIADQTTIGVIYKNDLGWSEPYYLGVNSGDSRHPRLTFDSQYNLFVVWEDNRFEHSEIYINRFIKNVQKWEGETRLTYSSSGSCRPSVSSYMDDIFVSFTVKSISENEDISRIKVIKYIPLSSESFITSFVSLENGRADYSDIAVNSAGNVFVAWHDNITGKYEIYASVLNTDLDFLITEIFDPYTGDLERQERILENILITRSHGGAKYPVLSEQQNTGNIYIVWQDYKEGVYYEFIPLIPDTEDPYTGEISRGTENDPYFVSEYQPSPPLDTTLYVAVFESITRSFLSSGQESFDVKLVFEDQRSGSIPAVPPFFDSTLPVAYESLMAKTDGFLDIPGSFTQVACASYDLSRDNENFMVIRDFSDPYDVNKDFFISGKEDRKEIRFGDFSNVLNVHYIFENFKYYTKDAVLPFSVNSVYANNFDVEVLNAHDAVINNYGDVWLVGTCGVRFYMNNIDQLLLVGSDSDFEEGESFLSGPSGNIKAIAFNKNNYMFVGKKDGGIYYSIGHMDGFVTLFSSFPRARARG